MKSKGANYVFKSTSPGSLGCFEFVLSRVEAYLGLLSDQLHESFILIILLHNQNKLTRIINQVWKQTLAKSKQIPMSTQRCHQNGARALFSKLMIRMISFQLHNQTTSLESTFHPEVLTSPQRLDQIKSFVVVGVTCHMGDRQCKTSWEYCEFDLMPCYQSLWASPG